MTSEKRLQRQTEPPLQCMRNIITQHREKIDSSGTPQRVEPISENITRTHHRLYLMYFQ